MFKKLVIASAIVSSVAFAFPLSAQANPTCQNNPGLCLTKLPNIPISPVQKNPIFVKKPFIPVQILPYPFPPKPQPQPQPDPSIGINVNFGGGEYGGDGFVSCHEARSIVRHHGYRHVHTDTCGDGDYTFFGTKHGHAYVIEVSDSGEILGAESAN